MIWRLALLCALAGLVVASVQTAPLQISNAQTLPATATATSTSTSTKTRSVTASPSRTPTPPLTTTSTVTATASPTSPVVVLIATFAIATRTPTPVPTTTPTSAPTSTLAPTPSSTATPTQTATQTATPTALPASISDVTTSSITRSSATITWTTSQPATSQVAYGLQVADSHTPIDSSLVTAHRVVLTGLQPGAIYQFSALSTTATGVTAVSANNALSTAPAGSGPEVADLNVLQATSTTATLNWGTSTGTVAQVEFGASANYGSFTLLNIFTGPVQQITLTGLQPGTTYHWRIKAWDAQGALGASGDATFSTAPTGLATLVGDNVVQADRLLLPPGQAMLYQYIASQSGQASVVRLYLDAGSTAPLVRVALYSDQNGAPGAILSQGSAPTLAAGWISVSIPPVPLLESSRYWVGVLNPLGTGSLSLRQSLDGGSSLSSALTSLAAFPQPFVPGSAAARSPLAAYVQQVPPAISLTGPTAGKVVTGQTQLSALVDDDVPVTRLQFYVDGQPVGLPLTTPPFTMAWNTSGVSGKLPHTITARASDALGRSGTSALLVLQVDNGPAISAVAVSAGLTGTSMDVTWATDVASDAQVEYGPTTAYGLSTPVDGQMETRHDLQLTGLAPGAAYHYRVRSRDANGAAAVSADATFFTQGP